MERLGHWFRRGRSRQWLFRRPKLVLRFQLAWPRCFQRRLDQWPQPLQHRFNERQELFFRFQLEQSAQQRHPAAGDQPSCYFETVRRFDQDRSKQSAGQHESEQAGRWQQLWYERQNLLLRCPNKPVKSARRSHGGAEQQWVSRRAELFFR